MTTIGAWPLIELSPVSRPTRSAPYSLAEIAVLLVRERLDRRRVEGLGTLGEREVDGVLGDDGLARPGRGAHEDGLAVVEEVECVELEAVERIGMLRDELLAVAAPVTGALMRSFAGGPSLAQQPADDDRRLVEDQRAGSPAPASRTGPSSV